MKLTNNTVLVTGGSSGIGLQLSRRLIEEGNTVITCGRSTEKLEVAKQSLPQLITYSCDLADPQACQELAQWIVTEHPSLNVLINNAAMVHQIDFLTTDNAMALAEQEYQTNLLAPLRLIKLLYPTLAKHQTPAIINVTTGLIYAPRAVYPFYNSSKAALHSFTQTLRLNLQQEPMRIIEVMFPAVATPWHRGKVPRIAISVEEAVEEMLKGLKNGQPEIRVKGAKLLYFLSRLAPGFALRKINELA